MFIDLVAVVVTLFIIFGLLYARRLNDWVQSSIRCSIFRTLPTIGASLNQNVGNSERSLVEGVGTEYQDGPIPRITFNSSERSSDEFLNDVRSKTKNFNASRYSVDYIPFDEKERHLELPILKNLQFDIQDDITNSQQERRENVYDSLSNSVAKSITLPTSKLYTSQIYNSILKEAMEENAAKQKLLENARTKIDTFKLTEELPSSSENKMGQEDDAAKSSKTNLLDINL